ncbi:hypothetical protein ACK1X7_05035 [Streptomyces sp. CY1]|uniref:hypothetical protein n=1 Tax=Streptomyces sp. CY1 TaxID=3388313 RepID=UPI00399F2951
MRPLSAALLTAAIAATGIVAALAVAARGQDTGDPPAPDTPRTAPDTPRTAPDTPRTAPDTPRTAPDTPRSHRADPPDPSYWTPERVRDARPAPMPTDPRTGGGRQSPP